MQKKRKLNEEKSRKKHLRKKAMQWPDISQNQGEQRKSQDIFEDMGLSSQLALVCTQVGWKRPSPVQEYCIPRILSPFEYSSPQTNLCSSPLTFSIQAPPGSGKTASYVLPILHHLMNSCTSDAPTSSGKIKYASKSFLHFFSSLIIAPTNELCLQIYNQLLLFGEASRVKIGMIVGGGKNKKSSRSHFLEQLSMVYDRTVHVIIGTPGRLEYILLDSSAVSPDNLSETSEDSDNQEASVVNSVGNVQSILKNLHFLVLDEADMMMSEKSMERCMQRLIQLTVESKRDSIVEQSASEMARIGKTPNLSIILVSATLKKSTVNAVWSRCANAMNPSASESRELEFDNPSTYESLQYVPPTPVCYIAKDSMAVGELTSNSFNSLVRQECLLCPAHVKLVHLYLLLSPASESCVFRQPDRDAQKSASRKAIIFFNSKHECEIIRITFQQLGLSVCALHSLQSPEQRSESLFSFQMNVHSVLLATDVCCRGLDIASVDFIFHYDIPKTLDRYIHRIGRAVRESRHHDTDSSNLGLSILFVTEKDKRAFRKLEESVTAIMCANETEAKDENWKIERRREIREQNILKYLDVVLQSRLKAENIVSADDQESENVALMAA